MVRYAQTLVVLVLVSGLLAAVSATALAESIVGSYHDLSAVMQDPDMAFWDNYNDYGQVCIYCHTPHNSTLDAPLWNREKPDGPYTLYSSASLIGTAQEPRPYTFVCLSCHDGSIAVDAIINMPGGATSWSNPTYPGYESFHGRMLNPDDPGFEEFRDCGSCHGPDPKGTHGAHQSYGYADLSNDHPVSILYPKSDKYVAAPSTGKWDNGVRLYENMVECASCHDVHNPAIKPFLRTSNAGSALCTTCHVK